MNIKLGFVLAFAIVVGACGTDDPQSVSTTADETTPSAANTAAPEPTVETASTSSDSPDVEPSSSRPYTGADGAETTITDTSRIVSLNGDITEIIFELGLGDSVVAVDVTTTHPEAAAGLPVVGFGQQLAAEPLLAFEPSLVIGDQQIQPAESIQQLRDAGIPVVIIETQTGLDGITTKIGQVAEILGVDGEALAARVQAEVDEAVALAKGAEASPNVAFVYARGPQTILLFGAGMPTQSMIESAGAVDTGAATGILGAVPLTPEALVAAAPDVIVLPEAGLAALGGEAAFLGIPGVAETPAGAAGTLLSYDEAYFFNLGPRAGQALREFVLDLHPELG